MNSFNKMYDTFGIHGKGTEKYRSPNLALSTGINWIDSSKSIVDLLKIELESGLSHKSYGRSLGFKFVTDLISKIERDISKAKYQPKCILTNGTADASHIIFSNLQEKGYFKPQDKTLMINHGFPFYINLTESFKLDFHEIILPKSELIENQTYLTPIDKVIDKIDSIKPKVVFLIVPNNPFGEEYNEADLKKLNACILRSETKLIIDRVCLMSWNDYSKYNISFMDGLQAGKVYIVDSFSKGESTGGLRIGYLLTNEENESELLSVIRTRCLNPRAFGTLTMAISRVFAHTHYSMEGLEGSKYGRIKKVLDDTVRLNYPVVDNDLYQSLFDSKFHQKYIEETESRRAIMLSNFEYVKHAFGDKALIPIVLDGGFSTTVMIDEMKIENEFKDIEQLANNHNVGIITESVFRKSPVTDEHYFVRIGLPMPTDMFEEGINLMKEYYYNL